MNHDNCEPAFPSHGSMGEVAQQGMTLRDYFAAKAMLGLMNECYDMGKNERAEKAYEQADAMLLARSIPPKNQP